MIEDPTAAELVEAVAGWLAEPAAADHDFAARVARNALEIVAREMRLRPATERAEAERIARLIDVPDTAEPDEALALAIREGRIDHRDPALLAHLAASARDRLAIDQPRYAHRMKEGA